MHYILLIPFLIFAVVQLVKNYWIFLDMKNNPDENRPIYFWVQGVIMCAVAFFICMEMSMNLL